MSEVRMVRGGLAVAGVLLCALIVFMEMHQLRGYLLILAGLICLEHGVSELRRDHRRLTGWLEGLLSMALIGLAVESFI